MPLPAAAAFPLTDSLPQQQLTCAYVLLLLCGKRRMSGSEFAVRIALCDMIEKWKRSQERAKYYEECRNQLVTELQRVKQVNEDLVRENSILQASLETSASLPNRTDNAIADAIRQAKSHSPLIPSTSADRLRHEEDVNKITQRLLSEMQRDVAHAALKSQSMHQLESVVGSGGNKSTVVDDDAGAATNNSVGSELLVVNQPCTGSVAPQLQDHNRPWNKDDNVRAPIAASNRRPGSGIRSNDEAGRSKQIGENGTQRFRTPAAGQQDVHGDKNDDNETNDEKVLSQVYAKIIAALAADLNKATHTIVSQKEKLAKLKSKQLRSYFRRLKGEDQLQLQQAAGGNIPHPSAGRCHFEHV